MLRIAPDRQVGEPKAVVDDVTGADVLAVIPKGILFTPIPSIGPLSKFYGSSLEWVASKRNAAASGRTACDKC